MRQARIYRGVMYDTSSIERVLLNVVVRDKNVEKTIHAIQEAARTGEIGDGRIFVIPVEDTVRIRTGERGDIALYNAEQENKMWKGGERLVFRLYQHFKDFVL